MTFVTVTSEYVDVRNVKVMVGVKMMSSLLTNLEIFTQTLKGLKF